MRTTFITGFPGETDAEFDELVEFVGEQRFERLGVFTYSFEPDTPAAKLPDHLSEEVKDERRERLDGSAAGSCVRMERRANRPAAGRDSLTRPCRMKRMPGSAARMPMRRTWTASFT